VAQQLGAGQGVIGQGELVHQVDQVAEITAEPVELPRHQDIALAQCLKTGGEPGSVVALARGEVVIELFSRDTGREQRIALQG
jgi:hypothetical protein